VLRLLPQVDKENAIDNAATDNSEVFSF